MISATHLADGNNVCTTGTRNSSEIHPALTSPTDTTPSFGSEAKGESRPFNPLIPTIATVEIPAAGTADILFSDPSKWPQSRVTARNIKLPLRRFASTDGTTGEPRRNMRFGCKLPAGISFKAARRPCAAAWLGYGFTLYESLISDAVRESGDFTQ
jgi:hypothetical protein